MLSGVRERNDTSVDVSSTMAASAQTSTTPVSPLRAARVSSGIDASSFVSSFADVLEASLQESAESLKQASHGAAAETKSQAKGTSKKEDSVPASPVGTSDPALAGVLSPVLVPISLPGPAELQAPPPSISPDSQSSASDEIGSGQAPGAAQQYPTPETQIPSSSTLLPTNTDFPGNAAAQPTVPVAPQLNNGSFSPTVPSVSAPVTSAAADPAFSASSSQVAPFASQAGASAETVSPPTSTMRLEPVAQSFGAQNSTVVTANSTDGTNGGSADSVTLDPSGTIQDPAPVISASDTSSTASKPAQAVLPQAIDTDELAPAMPQETPLPQQKTDPHAYVSVPDFQPYVASEQSAAAAGTPTSAPTGASSDAAASATSTASVPVNLPAVTETAHVSSDKPSKETANASSPLPVNAPVANDHAASAVLHSLHVASQLQHFDNGSVSNAHNSPAATTSSPSVPPSQSQDTSNADDVSSQNSLTSTPLPPAQLTVPDATDVPTPKSVPATGSASGLDALSPTSSRDAGNAKVSASSSVSTIAGASSAPLNPTPIPTVSATPAAVTQVSELAGPDKSSTSSGNTTLPHGAAQNPTANQTLDDGPELSPAMHAWNGGENLQADLMRNPHLVEKLGQSEMNIAMQADALGAVQVRAHLAGDQVGAAITVEHHDLHAMLSNDLPALHQALSERQLRVANLSVHQAFSSGDAGIGGGKGQQHPQDGTAQRATPFMQSSPEFSAPLNFSTSADSSESRDAFDSQGRLSVRA